MRSAEWLRVAAAVVVAWTHLADGTAWGGGWSSWVAGQAAVAAFFVVSGLVVPASVGDRGPAAFLMARVVRLWPAWAVAVTGSVAIAWSRGEPGADAGTLVGHYAVGIRDLAGGGKFIPVIWTLETEARWYVAAAFLGTRLRRPSVRLLAAGAAALLVAGTALGQGGRLGGELAADCQAGALIWCGVVLHGWRCGTVGRRAAWLLVGSCLVVSAVCGSCGALADVVLPMWTGGVAGVAVACWAVSREGRCRLPSWAAAAAGLSYSLYAVHFVPGRAVVSDLRAAGAPELLAIAWGLACSVLLAVVLSTAIEGPARRLAATIGRDAGGAGRVTRRGDAK